MSRKKNNVETNNPCWKEQELTYKCFDNNDYDHSKCQLHIENYKSCKSFWHYVRMDRKRKGIHPNIPEPQDREQIKKEYLQSGHKM